MTEEQLMASVKNGDLDKASLLFDEYHKKLFNFFVKTTFDRDLSNDLTQNVFFRMLRYRTSYKEGNKFKSWIYQIARNVSFDHFRKIKSKVSDFKELENLYVDVADQTHDLERSEAEKTLYLSMSKLSDEQREVLVLSKFEELKYDEIAMIMNTTIANVKVKVHRAINKLREYYFELEDRV